MVWFPTVSFPIVYRVSILFTHWHYNTNSPTHCILGPDLDLCGPLGRLGCGAPNAVYINFNHNCTGGGGASEAPLDKCCRARTTSALSAARLHDFFFEVLRVFWHQVCENRTSRYIRSSGVTFCDQRSTRNVKFVFHFLYKTDGKVNL